MSMIGHGEQYCDLGSLKAIFTIDFCMPVAKTK